MTKFLYWSVRITRAAINWYIWLYVASSLNVLEINKNIYPQGPHVFANNPTANNIQNMKNKNF